MRFRASKTDSFATDRSMVVPLLQLFCVYASVFLYVTFDKSLSVPRLSVFSCLGKAVLRYCGISWVPSLIFLHDDFISNHASLRNKGYNTYLKYTDTFLLIHT